MNDKRPMRAGTFLSAMDDTSYFNAGTLGL